MPCGCFSSIAQITHPSGRPLNRLPLRSRTLQVLLKWIQRAEIDQGTRDGLTTAEREHVTALEREVKELRWVDEILKLASAFFAQAELDRRFKA